MKESLRKRLKQALDVMFRIDVVDILDKEVTPCGPNHHIILPAKYKRGKAKIIFYK